MKRQGRKFLAAALALALLVQIFPLTILAESDDTSPIAPQGQAEEQQDEPVRILAEDESLRTETEKHFLMSDGTYMAAVYDIPIHYLDENGDFQDIDNTLETAAARSLGEEDTLDTKEGPRKVKFAKSASKKKLVTVREGGYQVSWGYEGAQPARAEVQEKAETALSGDEAFLALSNLTSETVYRNAFPGVDLQYIVSPTGVKENIILNTPSARREFTLQYQINGSLEAVQRDARTIELRDGEETVYVLTAPVMTDAAGAASEALTLTLIERQGGKLTVQLKADAAWLAAEGRQYPVVLDPSFLTDYQDLDSVQTWYIMEYDRDHADGTLFAGKQVGGKGQTQSIIRFPSLPALSRGDIVVDAVMNLEQTDYTHVGSPNLQVNVYEVIQSWDWNNTAKKWQTGGAPSIDSTVIDYAVTSEANDWKFLSWNITRLVRQWYEGGSNNGVMLKAHDPTKWAIVHMASKWAVSAVRPLLQITYLNNKGLESYWDYTAQDLGGSGTSYVNNFSGNLVVDLPISHTNSANLPVGIDLVYNGYQAGSHFQTNAVSGWGWKLNYDRCLIYIKPEQSALNQSLYSLGYHYKYIDEDGTVLYMKQKGSGVYEDELGKGITLTLHEDDYWVMTDKQENKQKFDRAGRLLEVQGNQSNDKIKLSYTNGILTSITDGAGKVTKLERSGTTVTVITDPYGRQYSFRYSGGYLTFIYYPDGNRIQLKYDSAHQLQEIILRDGSSIQYAYGAKGDISTRSRVVKVTEYSQPNSAGTREAGNAVSFQYKGSTTTIKDRSRTVAYTFDNLGRTTSAIDDTGAASTAYMPNTTQSGKMYTNNKVSAAGSASLPVNNLFKNHSFERDLSDWKQWHTYPSTSQASIDSTHAYIGRKTVKTTKTTDSGSGQVYQAVKNPAPGYYTFSAYVDTQDLAGTGGAQLNFEVYNTSGKYTATYSRSKQTEGWERLAVTAYVPPNTPHIQLVLNLTMASGTAWFDCVQLEKGQSANEYNLLENSFFDNGSARWEGSTGNIGAVSGAPAGIKNAATLTGAYGENRLISQTITVNMPASEVAFSVSGYAAGSSVPCNASGRYFALDLGINYNDGTYEFIVPSFNPSTTAWQYTTKPAVPKKENQSKQVTTVTFYCIYYDNANTASFSGLQLELDKTGAVYSYDSKGNLISAKDAAEREQLSTIDSANRLTKYTDEEDSEYKFTYDSSFKHRVKTASYEPYHQQLAFEYNSHGQVTEVEQSYTEDSSALKLKSSSSYSSDGSRLLSQTDSAGVTVSYEYTAEDLVKTASRGGTAVHYTYDELERPLSVSATRTKPDGSVQTVTNSYTYAKDRLTGITHNGMTYGFEYNLFGAPTVTKVGSQALITNTYGANNGLLLKSTYGNGPTVSYTYDALERVIAESRGGQTDFEWAYDSKGRVAEHTDNEAGETHRYTYDMLGRLTNEEIYASNGRDQLSYTYDNLDRVTRAWYGFEGEVKFADYSYGKGGLSRRTILPNWAGVAWERNDLTQVTKRTVTTLANRLIETDYGYDTPSPGYTSNRVTSMELSGGIDLTLTYDYDNRGNITSIKENGTEIAGYIYDTLGQLLRENDLTAGKTITYEYDNGGNILNRKEYPYTTGELGEAVRTVVYGYEDANWKDKMTSYDGQTITYDAIGNPLEYRDGMEFTWQNGRELAALHTPDGDASYTYNADGIRTRKQAGGQTTEYLLEGSRVIAESTGGDVIWYYYDSDGVRTAMEYEGDSYYYHYNLQGDVLALVDEIGEVVVEYTYDSWGNILSVTGSMASTLGVDNPFRYRGYYYDEESGLYYLNSRYYEPVTGRFVNADGIMGINQDMTTYNLFAYCGNNPINRSDAAGLFWNEIFNELGKAFQLLGPVYAGLGGIAAGDGLLPFGDILALTGALVLSIGVIGYVTYQVTKGIDISTPKTEEKDKTVIYRYGGTNPGNLTPKDKDVNTGLSFSTVPRPGAAVTTIEALNATGIVYAVKDGPTHVSVRPVGVSVEDWIINGRSSKWTQAVRSVVVKWDGRG